MADAPNWLARYREDERDNVWTEMRELGEDIRDSRWAGEAQLVCDEMARRARHNIEVLVERLDLQGYRFYENDDDQSPVVPFCPATERADDQARWLVEQFGAVPMALLSWVRLVGDVWLVGTHPEWPDAAAADPLVIEVEGSRLPNSPIRKYFEEDFAAWREWSAVDPEVEPFVLPMAPDRFHKDNVSGGAPYGIVLPDGSVDGTFVADTAVPFVAYLNHVFMNGGFPWPTPSFTAQTRIRQELAEGLLLL